MMHSDYFSDPKLMMSDSLRDALPDISQTDFMNEGFIIVVLACNPRENSLSGNLAGVEVKLNNSFKLDLKVSIDNAFSFISNLLMSKIDKKLHSIIFSLRERMINFEESPYKIETVKIIDIDLINDTCILAIDLFKCGVEEK